jgi:hypothetical protein
MVGIAMRYFASILTGIAFLVAAAPVASGDQPDKPGKKEEGKKPDPLQALKEAYSKGVSIAPVELKDLPKEERSPNL